MSKQRESRYVKELELLSVHHQQQLANKRDRNAHSSSPEVYLQKFWSWILSDSDSRYVREVEEGGRRRTFIKEELEASQSFLEGIETCKDNAQYFCKQQSNHST